MPKLNKYFGLVVMPCNNGIDFVHAQDKFHIEEARKEIIYLGGVVNDVQYVGIVGSE